MPVFEYKGLTKDGKNTRGVLDSDNLRTARVKLKKDGIYVVDIKDKKRSADGSVRKSKQSLTTKSIPVQDMALMTRQLATLVKANIPLVDALTAVAEQVENPTLSNALADIKNMVNEGSPFHKALAKYPSIFSNIYISMSEAGEMSGTLDTILINLAEFSEAANDLRVRVQSAMTYPILMLLGTFAMMAYLMTSVVPKIVTVFEDNPQIQLPWYTVAVIDASNLAVNYWWIFLIVGTLSVFLFLSWKKTPAGKRKWDSFSLKLPLFGDMNRMVAVARFTRTLATLLNGGVPMLNALQIVRNVVNNDIIASAIDNARSNISEGETISGPLRKSGQFPPIVIHMVNIGEKTGDLENMLVQVSNAYDFQVKNKVDSLTSIMNPILIMIMGGVIGAIALAIMVPMFEMTNIAQ